MKFTFDRFRQIFWMVTSVTFLVLLFFFLFNNSSYIIRQEYKGITFLYKVNKFTGKIKINCLRSDIELISGKWVDVSELEKELEKIASELEKTTLK